MSGGKRRVLGDCAAEDHAIPPGPFACALRSAVTRKLNFSRSTIGESSCHSPLAKADDSFHGRSRDPGDVRPVGAERLEERGGRLGSDRLVAQPPVGCDRDGERPRRRVQARLGR